ncbi:hypothetical protein L6452_06014 [Arctium lappa]|uniref:Uncharacterized protein n=1 Tax=Arctium lappa TaxID=4217 RepID=A0ACB9EIA8_ARCLA|nr:hypothetical protein L6452_06014 [Arctium lappa]
MSMADFEPPSFYLGIDFDQLDSEPRIVAASEANKDPFVSNPSSGVVMILEDDVSSASVKSKENLDFAVIVDMTTSRSSFHERIIIHIGSQRRSFVLLGNGADEFTNQDAFCGVIRMPPRRNARRRRIEEVYGDGNPPPNQPNPEISEAVQQALNSMIHGLITQVVEVVRQAGGTATPNNAGGDSKKKSRIHLLEIKAGRQLFEKSITL